MNTNGRLEIGYFRGAYLGYYQAVPRRYFFSANSSGASMQLSQHGYTYDSALVATIYKPSSASSNWQMWFGNTVEQYRYDAEYTFTGPARHIAATTRSTNHQVNYKTFGSASRLYYYNLGGAITPNWQGSSSGAITLGNSLPQYAHWATPYWWAQMGQNGTC